MRPAWSEAIGVRARPQAGLAGGVAPPGRTQRVARVFDLRPVGALLTQDERLHNRWSEPRAYKSARVPGAPAALDLDRLPPVHETITTCHHQG